VPDEIVVPLIEKKLERSKEVKGFIFKGFPRTLVQSYILDGLLRKHRSSVSRSIEIQVPTLELIRRLDERSRTDRCMPYDNATARIVQRLHEHETKTVPVIEKYSQLHGVVKVDGMGSFEEVFARTSGVLESLLRAGWAVATERIGRYLDIHEGDRLDEKLVASWIRQASALPGWVP
jgi:adenylate kinase